MLLSAFLRSAWPPPAKMRWFVRCRWAMSWPNRTCSPASSRPSAACQSPSRTSRRGPLPTKPRLVLMPAGERGQDRRRGWLLLDAFSLRFCLIGLPCRVSGFGLGLLVGLDLLQDCRLGASLRDLPHIGFAICRCLVAA